MGYRRCGLAVCIVIAIAAAIARGAVPEQFRIWGAKAAEHPYLVDAALNSAAPVRISGTDAEKDRGFVLFARPAFSMLPADFAPESADRCRELTASDCAGQSGPVTFGVYALQNAELTIAISDLADRSGRKIAKENFDVRTIRFVKINYQRKPQIIPLLIERFDKLTIPAGRFAQLWITYFIPQDTVPGSYEGKISVTMDGQEKATLPIRLMVYPFKLIEPPQQLFVYYNNSTDPRQFPRVLDELIDQRCHGMNCTTLIPPVTDSGELPRAAMAAVLDLYKRAGFTKPAHIGLWNRITAEWLNTPDKSIGMWGPWFRYYPFSEMLDRRYGEAVKMIRDEAKARGIEVELSVSDEPGSHAWTTAATRHYLDLIKREAPDVTRELSVGGGWAMGRNENELWKGRLDVWTTNRWLADKLESVRHDDRKARIGLYNMAGGGSGPGGICTRAFYGVFLWKTGAIAGSQWTYWHSATPEDNHTWPAANKTAGNVPTLRWEAAREGAKDLRYIATLESKIAGRSGGTFDEARKLLEEIRGQTELRTMDYDPITGGRIPALPPDVYEKWRSSVAGMIQRIDITETTPPNTPSPAR